MSEIAACGGFPTRYHHWRFGQESLKMKKSYRYGLHKIYEMAINNDPCYAYLLEANQPIDHKVVIAHVSAHSDFFKNNAWYQYTNRNMLNEMGNHAAQIEAIRSKENRKEVDQFIDWCLSIENLIDIHAPFIERRKIEKKKKEGKIPGRLESQEDLAFYMEEFINPVEYLEAQKEAKEKKEERQKQIEKGLKLPPEPTKDIMLFLLEHAALEDWQRKILAVVREEAYYLAPQTQTKVMNEGWAKYWERKIIVEQGIAEPNEIVDDAQHTAGTVAKSIGRINPYRLGIELWKDIESRWNTGRHGKIWEECNISSISENWDEFVIFKNIWEETNHNLEDTQKQWAQWQAFKQAVKDDETDFPSELFTEDQYIMLWEKESRSFEKEADNPAPIPQQWFSYAKKYPRPIPVAKGREKMFEVRSSYNDITFIGEFFTEDFARSHDYFTYKPGGGGIQPDHWGIDSREFERVKQALLFKISNAHHPVIELVDANYKGEKGLKHRSEETSREMEKVQRALETISLLGGRKQVRIKFVVDTDNREGLFLKHHFEGIPLDIDKMRGTLEAIYHICGKDKPVYFQTVLPEKERKKPWWYYWRPPEEDEKEEQEKKEGKVMLFSFDGKEHSQREIGNISYSSPLRTSPELRITS